MKLLLIGGVLLSSCLPAQTLVIDRAMAEGAPVQAVERADGGFLGDSFQIGAEGEIWVIDSIRVWVARNPSASCPARLGDQVAKITLYGALENKPVPGEPECKCHALVPVRSVDMQPGTNSPAMANVKIAPVGEFWRIDFEEVRWSLPGNMKALFAVRAAARESESCSAAKAWSLSASPAASGYRLHRFDKDLVPDGLAEPEAAPKWLNVQVRAHRDM